MAKNYTFSEAVEIIAKGTDLEAIAEIGKRFPVLAVKVAGVAAKAGESFVDLMNCMPESLTANKVNTVIKNSFAGGDAESDEDTEDEAAEPTAENAEGTDYDSMSGKELVKLLRKAGKGKLITSKKKADLVELCKKELGGSVDVEDEIEEEDVETEENPYEGKTAMELFKECKKRGIKAEAKKPAKFYADLLVKDDEANAEAVDEADEADDWDDDEEEAPAPKAEKKSSKKSEKKTAKKAAEEDDDDDWDI